MEEEKYTISMLAIKGFISFDEIIQYYTPGSRKC